MQGLGGTAGCAVFVQLNRSLMSTVLLAKDQARCFNEDKWKGFLFLLEFIPPLKVLKQSMKKNYNFQILALKVIFLGYSCP